jgi:chromosome segregation ATPase
MAAEDEAPTRRETERRATRLAEERGRDQARIEAKFQRQDEELAFLRQGMATVKSDIGRLSEEGRALKATVDQYIAVSQAVANQLKESSGDLVTRKTYLLGLVGTIIALGMLLVSGLVLIHGGAGK